MYIFAEAFLDELPLKRRYVFKAPDLANSKARRATRFSLSSCGVMTAPFSLGDRP
jgi:hypothetical protein